MVFTYFYFIKNFRFPVEPTSPPRATTAVIWGGQSPAFFKKKKKPRAPRVTSFLPPDRSVREKNRSDRARECENNNAAPRSPQLPDTSDRYDVCHYPTRPRPKRQRDLLRPYRLCYYTVASRVRPRERDGRRHS